MEFNEFFRVHDHTTHPFVLTPCIIATNHLCREVSKSSCLNPSQTTCLPVGRFLTIAVWCIIISPITIVGVSVASILIRLHVLHRHGASCLTSSRRGRR